MRKKTSLIAVLSALALIIILAIGINLFALNDLKRITTMLPDGSACEIDVMDYSSGHSVYITDIQTKQQIIQCLSQLQYDGLFLKNGIVSANEEQAYSLTIWSDSFYAVFHITDAPSQSNAITKNGKVSIKNYDALHALLKNVFDESEPAG